MVGNSSNLRPVNTRIGAYGVIRDGEMVLLSAGWWTGVW
jgi:hypothetical protein